MLALIATHTGTIGSVMHAQNSIGFFIGLQLSTLVIVDKAVAAAAVPWDTLADAELAETSGTGK